MKALSTIKQTDVKSSPNVVATNSPSSKTLPSARPNFSPVLSSVNSQLPLQKMSSISGDMEGHSFSVPSGGIYAPIQRAEVELQGEKSLGARFNSFFFGQESTFTQLEKKYAQFKKEIDPTKKGRLGTECIQLGNTWLGKHPNPKSENDLKKKQSIQSMLASLSQAPAPQKLPEPGKVVVEPKVGPVLPILAPDPGKVVEEPKVDPVVPAVQSNFSTVKSSHDAYKAAKKGSYSPGELFAIYNTLSGFLKQLNLWDLKFASPKNPAFDSEKIAITEFRSILNENFEYNSGLIAGTVKGINIENLSKGIFSANSLDAVITLPNGNASGTLQNIQIKEAGIEFSSASMAYSGNIVFGEIFKVGNPTMNISSNASGFDIRGAGDLQFNLDNVQASGHVEISYNTSTQTFENPTFSDVNLTAGLLNNTLNVTANNVNYAGEGALSAESASLKMELMGKSFTGSGSNISYSKENGLDWGVANFSFPDEISLGGIVKVKGLEGIISGAADGYKKSGSGTLSLDLPDGSSATGTVAVSFEEGTGWKVDSITNGGITASILGNTLTVNNIQIANGDITAKTGSMQLDIGGAKVDVTVTDISLGKDKKFDWGLATFKSPNELNVGGVVKVKDMEGTVSGAAEGYKKSGTGNLAVDLPGATASGTLSFSQDETSGWKVDSITGGAISATVLGSTMSINEIQYVNGIITAQTGSMLLNIGGAIAKVDATTISIGEDKKINWGIANFSSPNEIDIGGIVKVNGLAGTMTGEADGFKKTGVGTLSINLPGASAGGTIAVSHEEGRGWKVDSITNGEINASLLNGSIEIAGTGISFENNVLGIAAANASVSTGGLIPGLDKVSGQAQNIKYKDGDFDWESITLGINSGLSFGDNLSFGLKTATLFGKSKGYQIDINDAYGSISIGKWLTGEGTGSFSWDIVNKKKPEITSANLTFLATSPVLPKDIIPGLLPIDFSAIIPFAAGVVPMEARIALGVDASASVSIGGTVNYSGSEFVFGVNAAGNGSLSMSVTASLAVGSSALVSLGAFLKGSTTAALEAGLEFKGKAAKQGEGYNFSDINAKYNLGANVIAELSGGVEVRALLIFSKTLYEVKIKSWDMGRAEKTGTFNFLNGEHSSTGDKGVMGTGKPELGEPVTEHQSLPFVKSMEAVAAAIDAAKKISANAGSIAAGLDAGSIDKSQEELMIAKNQIVVLLRKSINVTMQDPEFIKLSARMIHYQQKLSKIIKENSEWEAALEFKKKNPPMWHFDIFRGDPVEVYTNKIAEGKQKQSKYLARNEKKKEDVQTQLSIYQKQIADSLDMGDSIDTLLHPLNQADGIQEKINQFNILSSDIDNLHSEIEKEDANEAAELALDREESDYIKEDLKERK